MPVTMNGTYDGVLDVNHDNPVVLGDAQAAGIIAVIHKATEGASWQDPLYERRRYEASALGLLWGAYHFSSGRPPESQVDNFLKTIQWGVDQVSDAATLLALDYETSTSGPDMSVEDACTFVSLVNQRTGRWPLVYGSNLIAHADAVADPACPLSNCPLWYANYNDQPQSVPKRVWKSWSLWQYSDGRNGPGPTLSGFDRSCVMGTQAALQQAWPALA
ncbi:glycoside hydrolase family 25 protein [Caballeronia sp. LjRoot31]|uniref:glycoside hydrolase family 25 protein n=1 Tax=Caballeronia sp. LjRoot31 TaxID=3342324 RepID=UPI003ECCBBF7